MSAASDLNSRLAALEAAVEELQSQAGESEALSPNYLSIDPTTGTVGADFTGKVNALGLTLPGDGAITGDAPDNLIQWDRSSDGAMVANVYGAIAPPGSPGAGQTYARIEAGAPDNPPEWAVLQLYGNHPPPFTGQNRINCVIGGQEVTLIDDTGASSYLQAANNLLDVNNVTVARRNLGFGNPSAAYRAAALNFTVSGPQIIPMDTVEYDPDGNITSNGAQGLVYLCPATGYYLFLGEFIIITSAASFLACNISHWNGASWAFNQWNGNQIYTATAAQGYGLTVARIVKCNQGDMLGLGISPGAVSSTSLQTNGVTRNYFSVMRIL